MIKHFRIWYVISLLVHGMVLLWMSTVQLPSQVHEHARPISLHMKKLPPVSPPSQLPPKPVVVEQQKPDQLHQEPKPVIMPQQQSWVQPVQRPVQPRPASQPHITPIQVGRAAGITPTAHASVSSSYHPAGIENPNVPAPTTTAGAGVPDMSAPPMMTANNNPYAHAVIPRGGRNGSGPGGPAGVSGIPRGASPGPTAGRPRTIVGITRKAKLTKGRLPKLGKTAQEKRLHGTVALAVTITADGTSEVAVGDSSGFDELDKAARDAVKKWAVRSAMTNGVAKTETINVHITFMSNGDVTGEIMQ